MRPGSVLAAAARAGRRYWKQILAVAIPVAVVSAGLEILIDHFADPNQPVVSASASLTATFISMLGTVLLSGFVCRLAGAAEHNWRPATLSQAARTLPWWPLIGADLLAAAVVVIGLLLFILPGLVALTLLAVVGPVIEIEHQRVRAAVRRSVQLVRPHFWPVVLLATIPIAVAAQLEALAPEPHTAAQVAQFLVVRGLADGVIEACIALVLAELCFQLIDAGRRADRASAPAPAGTQAAARPEAAAGDEAGPPPAGEARLPDH